MIRFLLLVLIVVGGAVVGLSIFLQPNDLASCNDTPSNIAPCQPVDAIVAVSGGDTNARTDEAIRMYKLGWSDQLIFSGAAKDKTGLSNAAAMKIRATNAGVPVSAITLEEDSETTKQNAENTKELFDSHNIHSIMLVTSGYHQKRASLEFHKWADGVTIYNHPLATDQDWSMWWWTNPHGWTLAVTEFFKVLIIYSGIGQ